MSKRNAGTVVRPRVVKAPKQRQESRPFPWKVIGVTAAVAVLVGASFITPRLFGGSASTAVHAKHGAGDGPEPGSRIPFSERDVATGAEISSKTLRGKRTLLFFSEGVMCQACFEQIRDIEKVGAQLEKQGIRLISITPDSGESLRDAVRLYGISTPMISDADRDMSAAFDTLGRGMHTDTPGHAFVLLDKTGRVVWQRDYWLNPYRTMYVKPEKLLADLAAAMREA